MAEVQVFAGKQIGQSRAQLKKMSLSGRTLRLESKKLFKVDIFGTRLYTASSFRCVLPKSGAISQHKNSHISPGISHRCRTTDRIYVDNFSPFLRDWKREYRAI